RNLNVSCSKAMRIGESFSRMVVALGCEFGKTLKRGIFSGKGSRICAREVDTRVRQICQTLGTLMCGSRLHILLLLNCLHGYPRMRADELAVAPAPDCIVALEAPPRINHSTVLGEKGEEGLCIAFVDCLNETVNRMGKCGAAH